MRNRIAEGGPETKNGTSLTGTEVGENAGEDGRGIVSFPARREGAGKRGEGDLLVVRLSGKNGHLQLRMEEGCPSSMKDIMEGGFGGGCPHHRPRDHAQWLPEKAGRLVGGNPDTKNTEQAEG